MEEEMAAEMSAIRSTPALGIQAQAGAEQNLSGVPPAVVRRQISVRASAARAFRVFAAEMDSWWPRTHHIGKSPMQQVVVEPRIGGAIYTVQEDGNLCPWATVLAWEPPHRFVMAWQITPDWQYEPDLAHSSEVEVRFTPAGDGSTLVELEHRGFERHRGDWELMRGKVKDGWPGVLAHFAAKLEADAPAAEELP